MIDEVNVKVNIILLIVSAMVGSWLYILLFTPVLERQPINKNIGVITGFDYSAAKEELDKEEEEKRMVQVELLNNSTVFKTIYANKKDIKMYEHELVIYNNSKVVYRFSGII
jgi:arginine/lysine/ornithine decarboxylase